MHIISDHGNDYTLELKEVSADQAGGFDATVFWYRPTRMLKRRWPTPRCLCPPPK